MICKDHSCMGMVFVLLSPNRHDKTPSYTRGRHILLIEDYVKLFL